jgi:hypothetical protein
MPPFKGKHYDTSKRGHFYFGQRGHYHFGMTYQKETLEMQNSECRMRNKGYNLELPIMASSE